MLKRIYIDNFRCLVNFELSLDPINLFLGPNGAGKSTLFEVLRKIQSFLDGTKVTSIFDPGDLTRWQTSPLQRFELEIEGNGGIYKYELAVEHRDGKQAGQPIHIYYERLWFNDQPLFQLDEPPRGTHPHILDAAQLYNDDYSKSQVLPINRSHSAIALMPSHDLNTRLIWFRQRIERFIIVQVNPLTMDVTSIREEIQLNVVAKNFVSWYRHVSQNQGKAIEITKALGEALDGFEYFRFKEGALTVLFSGENDKRKDIEYRFDELSDGQRALIVLYTLIHFARSQDYTLCIDEPENFLALPEIQPWLTLLYDLCSDGELQALLISHHPELIDYLASSASYWFDYQSNTPVRVKRITDEGNGLPIFELVARGWLHA